MFFFGIVRTLYRHRPTAYLLHSISWNAHVGPILVVCSACLTCQWRRPRECGRDWRADDAASERRERLDEERKMHAPAPEHPVHLAVLEVAAHGGEGGDELEQVKSPAVIGRHRGADRDAQDAAEQDEGGVEMQRGCELLEVHLYAPTLVSSDVYAMYSV